MDTGPETEAVDERFRIALQSARQIVFDWSIARDHLEFVGDPPAALAGFFRPEMHSSRALIEVIHPDDREILRSALSIAVSEDTDRKDALHQIDVRIHGSEGAWTWIGIQGRVVERDEKKHALRMVGTISDISGRKHTENQVGRLTDLYAALSATNQAILRGTDLPHLYQEICRIAVEFGRFRLAWIGMLEEGSGLLSPVASHGTPLEYVKNINVSVDASLPNGRGPGGVALRSNEPSIWNDFLARSESKPWEEAAREAGFRSVACFPIRRADQPCGGLLLYSGEPAFFDASLVELLTKMAADISFALENFAREAERGRIQMQLLDSEALTSAVLSTALDGILSIDHAGAIRSFNSAAERTLKFSAADVLGRHFVDVLVPPRLRTPTLRALASRVVSRQSRLLDRRLETVGLRGDGSEIPLEVAIAAVPLRGEVILTVYLRDISELRQSQSLLRESAVRYRQLVERSPEALLVHSDGILLLANTACLELLGATADDQLLGKDIFEFIHARDHAAVRYRMRAVIDDPGHAAPFTEQTWFRLDRSPITVEVAATRVEFEDLAASQVVLRDITERRRTEDLQDAQNKLLSMIAAGAELSVILAELAHFIESQSKRARCTVMLVDAASSNLTSLVAPSFDARFIEALDPTPIQEGVSVCGTAAFRGVPVVVREVRSDPLTAQWLHLADDHGVNAVSSWPIMGKSGQILGTFALYYTEPTEPSTLEMSLIAIATDLAGIAIESRHAEERIRYLAHYDELTGLPNRVLFKQLLDHALSKARRNGLKLATFILDLDRFKNINDTFGHAVGDQVLREVSSRFRRILRDSDRIARMGGDEFFILIEDLEQAHQATEVARRVMREAARPFLVENQECQLSASIGIAVFPDDGSNSETLLKNSDIAMYRAKSLGKDNFQFYSASKNIHTVERLALESRLRRAIESGEFVLHYQPRVALQGGAVTGVEALVRWRHPERGMIPPAQFIPIAEETGWIVPLGREILRMAFVDARLFEATLGRPLRTAINLSVRQLDDPNFVRDFMALMEQSGVEPTSIELEITESMLIHNPEQAQKVVSELQRLGIHFAIDDFGTGYSSLTYLKRFPVASVKIDRSFIQDIPADANDMALTQAIIAMAHSLGLHVVAEGVETIEQANMLRQFGCDEYQGYLFSKAVPIGEILNLLRQSM